MHVLGDTFLLLQATVCHCMKNIAKILFSMAGNYIKMPAVNALDKVKQEFYSIASEFKCKHENTTILDRNKNKNSLVNVTIYNRIVALTCKVVKKIVNL